MASRGAVHRRSSKAADMQEQIRRLVDMCERYHIRLRITHTPGALLDQPDAISRQSGVEEPRTRLSRASFSVPGVPSQLSLGQSATRQSWPRPTMPPSACGCTLPSARSRPR